MKPKRQTQIYAFRISPDAKIKLQLISLAKQTTMSQLLDEMIDRLWEQEKNTMISKTPRIIVKDVPKIFKRLYEST